MKKLECLRGHGAMNHVGREKIQLGQTGFFLGDLPNLLAGALEVDIYCCPKCGKLEFFVPGVEEDQAERPDLSIDELPPEGNQSIVGVSRDGVPQVRCPNCGKTHDFDYPKCIYCDYDYYK